MTGGNTFHSLARRPALRFEQVRAIGGPPACRSRSYSLRVFDANRTSPQQFVSFQVEVPGIARQRGTFVPFRHALTDQFDQSAKVRAGGLHVSISVNPNNRGAVS